MSIYFPPTQNSIQKTLDAQLLSGVTASMTLNNVVGIANKPGVCVVDFVDTNNVETPTKREYIAFTGVSGNTLTGLTRNADGGGSDQDHVVGAIVQFPPDILQQKAIIDTILVQHGDDGVHTDALVTSLKASGADINTGTEDAKIVTPKAIADSNYIQNKDGWISANETWTYASATTITVPSGAAAKYAKGDKIKLTQTTVKYFYIVGVADTVLTITGGSSYTLTNATISANYYSHASSPIGFPSYFSYTPVLSAAGGTVPVFTVNGGYFNIVGTLCQFNFIFSGDGGTDGSGTDDLKISTPVTHLQIGGMLGTIGWYGTGTSENQGIIFWSSSTLIAPRKSITLPLTSGEFPNGGRYLYGECTLYI